MSDFVDPATQANLDRLLQALRAKEAELEQLLATARETTSEYRAVVSESEAVAARQAESAAARPPGEGSILGAARAVEQQARAEEQVNQQIARQIELQAQAARAARRTASAAEESATTRAAARVQQTVEGQGVRQAEVEAAARSVRQAQAPPRPPIPPTLATAAGGVPPASAAREYSAEEQRLIAQAEQQAAANSKVGASIQKNVLEYTQGDNALARHGALTTEFIQAAARGQVTIREFGNQVGATIGKFAGWTGAAAAVYGVLGAVTELGKGVIDSSNTVGQLHRTIDGLDNRKASEALIGLSRDTNVGMKDAGDAVFQFSRTFPDLNDSVTVARLALQAYQLDGVKVGDTVKAVTAIHQQFKIGAQQMGPVFDELGAGQRGFNARVSEQIPLLQRSASAVKNAGGDLHDFIAITTTALRSTQLSGPQLGTAFLRSASTFLNPATPQGQKGRGVLQTLGIDPNQNYTDLILSALKKSATLSDAQRQELSRAVFGPLLGGRTAGFFTGGSSLIDEVQKQLSPDKVKGTFQEEFNKEMETARQTLKRLGTDLQQLGAELARSGLLSGLGVMVHALDDGLRLATALSRAFSNLPAPLREAAGILATFAAARAVATKTGTNLPLIGPSAESRTRAQIETGLGAEQAFYQGEAAKTARSAANAGVATRSAEMARNEAIATGDQEVIIAQQRRFLAAQAKQEELEAQAALLRADAVAVQEQINAFQARTNAGMKAEAAAAEVGVAYRLNTLERGVPVAQPTSKIGGPVAGGVQTPGGVILPAGGEAEKAAAAAEADAVAATKTGGTIGRLSAAGGRLKSGISALGGLISGNILSLLAVGVAFGDVIGKVNDMKAAQGALYNTLSQQPGTLDEARAQAAKLHDELGKVEQTWAHYIPVVGDVLQNAGIQLNHLFGGDATVHPIQEQIDRLSNQLYAPKQTRQIQLPAQQSPITLAGDALRGKVPPGTQESRTAGVFTQLLEQAKHDTNAVKNNAASRAEWYRQLAEIQKMADKEIAQDYAAAKRAGGGKVDPKVTTFLNNALNAMHSNIQQLYEAKNQQLGIQGIDTNDPFAQFRGQDPKQITQQIQALADRTKIYGASGGDVQKMAYAYTFLAQKFAHSTDPKDLQLLSTAQSSFVDAARKQVQDLLNQADVAQDPKQKQSLLNQARQAIRATEQSLKKSEGAVDPKLRPLVEAADKQLFAQFDALTKQINSTAKTDQQQQAFEVARLRTELAKARDQDDPVKQAQDDQAFARKELHAAHTEKERLQAQIDLANADNAYHKALEERTQAQFNYQEALAGYDPVRQAAIKINAATADLQSQKQGTKGYYDALAKQVQAQQDLAKQMQDVTQARFTYQAALTEDPVAKAQIQLQAATQQVAYEAGHGGTNTKAYIDAAAKQAEMQQALARAIEDRAQAQFVYLASLTQDPVKKAAIDLRAATQKVAYDAQHGGTGTATYLQDAAKANDARQKLIDAHIQDREDTIQFKLNLSKISTETAIQEYEALLNVHHITRAKRREILTKINELQKGSQSEFGALDLGTIRLPTPYEIRRAVAAAKEGMSVTQHYSTNIQVTDSRSASQVGVQMDRYHRGTSKALARALGAR